MALGFQETFLELVIDHQGRFYHDLIFRGRSKWVPAVHVQETMFLFDMRGQYMENGYDWPPIASRSQENMFRNYTWTLGWILF